MADPSVHPCVLVVADRDRVDELVAALSELPQVDVLVSSGGDDTLELFQARHPAVVVMTASLQQGDPRSLIAALRSKIPRAEVAILVIGDDAGPVRTALDALDLAPDRFVTRPLSAKALRFAVTGSIDAVRIVRGISAVPKGFGPLRPMASGSSLSRAEPLTLPVIPPPVAPAPSAPSPPVPAVAPLSVRFAAAAVRSPVTLVPPLSPAAASAASAASASGAVADGANPATRSALRARWEALADSILDGDEPPAVALSGDADGEPDPLPPPILIKPRRHAIDVLLDEPPAPWKTDAAIGSDVLPELPAAPRAAALSVPEAAAAPLDPAPRTRSTDRGLVVAARTSSDEVWSEPTPIAALSDRDPRPDDDIEDPFGDPLDEPIRDPLDDPDERRIAAIRRMGGRSGAPRDDRAPTAPVNGRAHGRSHADLDVPLHDYEDEAGEDVPPDEFGELGPEQEPTSPRVAHDPRLDAFDDFPEERPTGPISTVGRELGEPRDFARELRAKMSAMAQRLFHGGDLPAARATDHAPLHDHHTEIDLAALGIEPRLGMPELEGRSPPRHEVHELITSPGSWDSQVRERGLADSGALVRGVSDAAMLLAKMFAQGATGRVMFRRDDVETIVYFDRGRPVFASSNEPRDRMGELLLREGKITAAQYERCQSMVSESGRRTGEILVDFGYLKRRELLPAVRRHVEDILYSLFSWERGSYRIALDPAPSAERIRLSRHPASLIIEGLRRKLDRASLERLLGAPSTVIEVPDRDRLGGIINLGDLAAEERAALVAFDGQTDLAQVARATGVELGDILPLAWGLCVLGLATARRTDTEASDESSALVGETDLAIDRERVRARWQLVTDADYFALLGVRRDATGFEIRRAYQSARRDFAAECFPGELRRARARALDDIAQVLDEAYRVLRDDQLRQTYLANLIDE